MSTPASALPPPPMPDVKQTGADKVGSVLGGISQPGSALGSISDMIEKHHQKRQAEAKMYHDIMVTKMSDPAYGDQSHPDNAKVHFEYDAAKQAYEKAAGVDAETKKNIQARTGLAEKLAEVFHKHQQSQGGGATAPASAPPGAPPPPPSTSPQGAQSPAGSPQTSSAASAALPPPPKADMTDIIAGLPAEQQRIGDAQTLKMDQAEEDIKSGARISEIDAGKKFTGAATYSDPTTGGKFTGVVDPASGKILNVDTREVVPGATKETASMQAAPTVKLTNGVPTGVMRDGKLLTPDSPDWSADDARVFDAAKAAYTQGNADKMKLSQDRMNAYINARAETQQYGVIDKTTGEPVMVNAKAINANPGRYGPGALTQQLKNRAGVFDEIDATKDQFNSALDKLSDKDFETLPRAQIALALQDRDPASALSTFLGSEVGTTLSPAQVDYITGLMTMTESAMALRSIAGMGQGSDKLRSAITDMLPSGKTPSKAYAKRQMDLFEVEMKALRKAVPGSNKLGMSPPPDTGIGGTAFKAPADAPPAPKEDGHKLKKGGTVIAVSKGGQWVSPTTQ